MDGVAGVRDLDLVMPGVVGFDRIQTHDGFDTTAAGFAIGNIDIFAFNGRIVEVIGEVAFKGQAYFFGQAIVGFGAAGEEKAYNDVLI